MTRPSAHASTKPTRPIQPAASNGATPSQGESKTVIVDGSNVAHSTEGEKPLLENLLAVRDKLNEEGFDPVIVADASLRHRIDDPTRYERMIEAGEVRQTPAGTDADYFILSFARELNATIVSNDRFRDRLAQFPEAQERIIRYMIVNREVVLERRTHRRD
jgi:hypothetical protein